MKQIEFAVAGPPEEVVRCTEVEAPAAPGPDDVLVKVLAFPINPADLLTMQGIYPRADATTPAIGNEAAGEIAAIGENVRDLAVGDRVILLSLNNWREYRLVNARDVVRISPRGDILQQAGLKVNPATADLLLSQFVELEPGAASSRTRRILPSAAPQFSSRASPASNGQYRPPARRRRRVESARCRDRAARWRRLAEARR